MPLLLALSILCMLTVLLYPSTGSAISLAAMIFSAFLLSVLIHESGHLLTGIALRLKPQEMIVGPFRLLFTERSLLLRFNYNWLRFGGTVRFGPSSDDPAKMAYKWSWMSLGGPAASLLTGLLIPILGQPIHIWGEWLMWINLAIGAVTLAPLPNGVGHSDGKLFMILVRKSARASLLMSSVILQKDYLSDRHPSEWNPGIIAAAVRLLDSLPERTSEQLAEESELRLFLCYHFADRKRPEQAVQYIQPVALSKRSSNPSPIRSMIDSFYASHLLLRHPANEYSRHEAATIVEELPKREPYSYHKAWAAMLAVQGNKKEAEEHLSRASLLLDRWFKPFGTYHVERHTLLRIESLLS